MAKRKNNYEPILNEKEIWYNEIKQNLQQAVDLLEHRQCMGDFMKEWNSKNKEKIQEMVKLGEVILFRFNKATIHLETEKLTLF